MRVRTVLLGLLVLGCTGRLPFGQDAAASDDPLLDCLTDVWQSRVALSCTTACAGSDPLPECPAGDCEKRSFLWFRPTGDEIEGFFAASREQATFSSVGPPTSRAYELDGDRLTIVDGGIGGTVDCSSDELTWNDTRWMRAPDGAEEKFEGAFDAAGWRGQPYLR